MARRTYPAKNLLTHRYNFVHETIVSPYPPAKFERKLTDPTQILVTVVSGESLRSTPVNTCT